MDKRKANNRKSLLNILKNSCLIDYECVLTKTNSCYYNVAANCI